MCVSKVWEDQKISQPLNLEFQQAGSCYVNSESQTWIFHESSEYSQPQSNLSSLHDTAVTALNRGAISLAPKVPQWVLSTAEPSL